MSLPGKSRRITVTPSKLPVKKPQRVEPKPERETEKPRRREKVPA